MSCASSVSPPRTASGRSPIRSNLFAIQEAKLALARVGADYLVYRGGRATVGPVALGSDELRALRTVMDTAVYSTAKREVSQRVDGLDQALGLAAAIVQARLAA